MIVKLYPGIKPRVKMRKATKTGKSFAATRKKFGYIVTHGKDTSQRIQCVGNGMIIYSDKTVIVQSNQRDCTHIPTRNENKTSTNMRWIKFTILK
jgi:hypothetical protein